MSEDPAASGERAYLKSRGWVRYVGTNPRVSQNERWFDPEYVGRSDKAAPGVSHQTALIVQRARDAAEERGVWRDAAAAAIAHGHGPRNESGECCFSTHQVSQIADTVLAAYRERWKASGE